MVIVEERPQLVVYEIVVEPGLIGVTSPVTSLMVAIAVLLLIHFPPGFAFDKVVFVPIQILFCPVIGAAELLNRVYVPVLVKPEATQLEFVPYKVKFFSSPFLLFPLKSRRMVSPGLFALTRP